MTFDTAGAILERLGRAADQLAADAAPASPAGAMARAEGLYAAIDRLEAAATACVQAVDASGEARADGYPSTVAWLRESCRMTDGDTAKAETLSVILQKCRTRLAYLPLESFQLKEAATKFDISARSRTRLKIGDLLDGITRHQARDTGEEATRTTASGPDAVSQTPRRSLIPTFNAGRQGLMDNPSDQYLILDRADPNNPRWVVTVAIHTRPATVPDDLDHLDGRGVGSRWFSRFHYTDFAWLEWLFGRPMALRMTDPGQECWATRIADHGHVPSTYNRHHNPKAWARDN